MSWPKKVPILDADDIHRGTYNGPNGTHCLVGWLHDAFGHDLRVCTKVDALLRSQPECPHGIVAFNDSRATKSRIAKVWNRVMAQLGYTEICER